MKKILDGSEMYSWAQDLFPICRSLTGAGVRETLSYIKKLLPDLDIHEIKSGEKVMDWKVPQEWDIKDAYVKNEKGEKIIDFRKNNLHLVSYSEPIDTTMSLKDLQKNLHSIPAQPDAIPYITSYYSRNWGFCISQQQRDSLMDEKYQVFIDSELKNGVMNYADLVIKGKSSKEILLSTYICHPSMGNNELSGPIVSTALAKWISSLNDPYYTYRFIFIPETIGSIAYLSKHMEHLKVNVIAGFNITCVGDDRCYSFMPSRNGSTLADRVGKHVLSNIDSDYQQYTWLDRGSDERQYCAPGVDLPIATIMRSKYGEYPEYHTSLDDLSLISPAGLRGGLNAFIKAIEAIEFNFYPKVNVLGEPQLGKRGLYPETSTLESTDAVRTLMDFITYADGTIDLLEIAEKINIPIWELYEIVEILVDHGLISALEEQK
tara:strand:+ start:1356 stop:2654 length:1299 start_codon:yes stop_codon:yes gene_type:complete